MNTLQPRVLARIDLAALRHNLARIREIAPQTAVLAVIKADAYGHGLAPIARALEQADGFAVATMDEGMALRQAGIKQRIVLMMGFFHAAELAIIDEYQLDVVVHHRHQLELLESASLNQRLRVWMKIDTGMHRLGFLPEETEEAYQRLVKCSVVEQPIHLMSHLASADLVDNPFTAAQIEQFACVTRGLSCPKSIANSAGILAWPESHFDWVRPGIALYGASPFSGHTGADHGLLPVMSLQGRLISVKHLRKNDRVGYQGRWTCAENMPVGLVTVGYGDGYPRSAPNGTPVLVKGTLCPIIGWVAMDFITVDLRPYPQAKVGDIVTLWGKDLPIEDVASFAESIPHELLARLTSRVHYDYGNAY